MQIVGVLLPLPFNEPFDYQTDEDVEIGEIVRVPFGREAHVGVVWKKGEAASWKYIRSSRSWKESISRRYILN